MMTPPLNSLHAADSQPESNPWSDIVSTPPLLVTQPLHTPSLDVLDGVASGGINADESRTPELEPPTHTDTFDTFDPQAHHEEQSAREAWASAEGHPAPVSAPSQDPDPDPDPQSPPQESGAPSSSSTFASFSSIARSFALPSLPNMNISLVAGTRTRPQSIDTADILRTPIIAGSFASQQDVEIEARGSPKMGTAALVQSPESAVQVQVQNVLRRENPSRERPGGKDKDPPFDFQKFLDQMKTKSAEPVARYLRSSVPSPHTCSRHIRLMTMLDF